MIKIIIYRSKEGKISGFKVTGHSGYEDSGKDIVCSAVSALTQSSLLGLLKVAEADADYNISEGCLTCSLKSQESGKKEIMCEAILETMYEGLLNIRESYKKNIHIVEEEV